MILFRQASFSILNAETFFSIRTYRNRGQVPIMELRCIDYVDQKVKLIDQTLLPGEVTYIETEDWRVVAEAIVKLSVRGAPAIGIAGAFGLLVGARDYNGTDKVEYLKHLHQVADALAATRPTAKNLFFALDRMTRIADAYDGADIAVLQDRMEAEALSIRDEDKEITRRLSQHGAELLSDPCTVMTHCNAGWLVTAGPGTALGVVYAAIDAGKKISVYADETRPLLQGARLTAWELQRRQVPVTLQCDNAAGIAMRQGRIDCVVVGADRIAANGDVANKIGTFNTAVLAHYHKIPFYVAAPYSTFDFNITSGADIPIEERAAEEVTEGFGIRTAPADVAVFNPAFDVTPAELVTAIITEAGVFRPPYGEWEGLNNP
jgi:methylthioribose-1-phosphate isomerase